MKEDLWRDFIRSTSNPYVQRLTLVQETRPGVWDMFRCQNSAHFKVQRNKLSYWNWLTDSDFLGHWEDFSSCYRSFSVICHQAVNGTTPVQEVVVGPRAHWQQTLLRQSWLTLSVKGERRHFASFISIIRTGPWSRHVPLQTCSSCLTSLCCFLIV